MHEFMVSTLHCPVMPKPRGQGGHSLSQYLADQLTLLQPGRADYPDLITTGTPNFFTFRHHCCRKSYLHYSCILGIYLSFFFFKFHLLTLDDKQSRSKSVGVFVQFCSLFYLTVVSIGYTIFPKDLESDNLVICNSSHWVENS